MRSVFEFFRLYKNLLIVSVFFILSIIGIYHHEIWLDEAHHFLLARDSDSFSEMIHVCRYEGHPLLWNSLLFIVTRFSENIFYMQLLHVLINCLTVFVICKSNLGLFEKIFVIFGFYFLYEYNIISRNYGLSAFLLLFLIYKYITNKENILLFSVIIFMLANTHLFSLLISFAFVFTYLIYNRSILLHQKKKIIGAAACILLAGWAISVYSIMPPENYVQKFISYDPSPYFSSERILKTVSVCLKGIFYVPDYTVTGHNYENTLYYLSFNLSNWKIYLLSALAIIIPLYIFKNNRFAFTLFCSVMLIFFLIYFFLPLNSGSRYFGFFYLIFVVCYWIAREQISKTGAKIARAIFALQFINGIFMYSLDLRYPFSESKNVTVFLKEVKKPGENIFILNRASRPAISAYSDEKYFGVENGELLSYALWSVSVQDSCLKLKLEHDLKRNNSALIVSAGMPLNFVDNTKLTPLRSFDNGIIRAENVTVYRYTR